MADEQELLQQVEAAQREITAVTNARRPISEEVAAENDRLLALMAKAKAAPGQWPGAAGQFNAAMFADTLLANMMLVAPKQTEAVALEAVKTRAAAWPGMRLSENERAKRLATLHRKLDQIEARAELARREQEAADSALAVPRAAPWRPEIWLQTKPNLERVANGRTA
jgi:hypothetical protein